MPYTEELSKEELPAISDHHTENVVEELVLVHQPAEDVIEVVAEAEDSAAVDDVHHSVFAEEVIIPGTASESFIAEVSSSEDLHVVDEAEGEVKVSEEAAAAPTMLVTDTDEALQGSLPQVCLSNQRCSLHSLTYSIRYS